MGKTSLDDFESPHTASLKPGDKGFYELFCLCGVEGGCGVAVDDPNARSLVVDFNAISYVCEDVCEEGHRLSFFSAVISSPEWVEHLAFGEGAEKSHSFTRQ